MEKEYQFHTPKIARAFYGSLLTFLILYVAYIGASILVPLVVAIFLSFLIVTLKDIIQSFPKIGKYIPGFFGYLTAFMIIAGGFYLLINIIRLNIESLLKEAPVYQGTLNQLLDNFRAYLPDFINLDQTWADFRSNFRIEPLIADITSRLRASAVNLGTVLLYVGFLLFERGAISKKIAALTVNDDQQELVNAMMVDVAARVRQYVSIKTFASAMVASLSFIILKLIGVDYASLWAILIFSLNFIPIVGSLVAVMFPVVFTLLQFEDFKIFLVSLLALTGAQMLVGNIIEPKLLGDSLNLSPLVILLSLALWASIWGVAGMLLCVPITVIMTIVLAEFDSTRAFAILLSSDGRVSRKLS